VRKADAVVNPAFWEIRDVLKDAGFQLWIENKVLNNIFNNFLISNF